MIHTYWIYLDEQRKEPQKGRFCNVSWGMESIQPEAANLVLAEDGHGVARNNQVGLHISSRVGRDKLIGLPPNVASTPLHFAAYVRASAIRYAHGSCKSPQKS